MYYKNTFITFIIKTVLILNVDLSFSSIVSNEFLEELFLSPDCREDLLCHTEPLRKETTEDLIKDAGYIAEHHEVRTEDGYWLTIHRIPRAKGKPPEVNKNVVILQHGLLGSSASWVLNGRENSLGFILSDDGYDVWIPNLRGNVYSRRHEFLDPDKNAKHFWDFSFHEMGTLDMPAVIDYILNSTGQSQVFYVGHSMGSTVAYVLLSTRPEYNSKISVFFAMAPVAYLGHIRSPTIQSMAFLDPMLLEFFTTHEVYEILPHNKWIDLLDSHLCRNSTLSYQICIAIMESLSGFDPKQLNVTIFHKILRHYPEGTSLKVIEHYGQLISGKTFCQYDYGWKKNLIKYGTIVPPVYHIRNISTPNLMFHGQNDWLSNKQDVDKLFNELPHIVGKEVIRYKRFNHIDFLFAIDIKELVYNSLVNILDRYRKMIDNNRMIQIN